jgi:hypothetical protein
MIYAKYHYRFTANDLQDYFKKFSWYTGIENNVENRLTYIDYKNIGLIQKFESMYPIFLSYHDMNTYDLRSELLQVLDGWGPIRIMGWSNTGKIFFANHSSTGRNGRTVQYHAAHLGIYDLKENRTIWHEFISSIYYFSNYNEIMHKILEFVSNEYNIILMTDYVPSNIEGYSIYSKIRDQSPSKSYLEIGLKNDNITKQLGNIYPYDYFFYHASGERPLSEDDLMYFCFKSPFEENIIALIVMIPSYIGGDLEGPRIFYEIFGIDLNELYE